jgi:hypothetical protein
VESDHPHIIWIYTEIDQSHGRQWRGGQISPPPLEFLEKTEIEKKREGSAPNINKKNKIIFQGFIVLR